MFIYPYPSTPNEGRPSSFGIRSSDELNINVINNHIVPPLVFESARTGSLLKGFRVFDGAFGIILSIDDRIEDTFFWNDNRI